MDEYKNADKKSKSPQKGNSNKFINIQFNQQEELKGKLSAEN